MRHLLKDPRFRSLVHWEPEFLRLFVRLALPMVMQNLVSASMQILDNVMVSGLGEVASAGVSQANRITFIVHLFLFGAVSGAGIFFAQFWGKGDIGGMRRVQGIVLRLNSGIALLFTVLVAALPRQALGIFLPPGDSFELGLQYLMIVLPVYLIASVDGVFSMMLKTAERPRIPMVAGIVSILTNTILNYGLIYGRLGLPAMGVCGAAYATVVSSGIGMCINVGMSYAKRLAPAATWHELKLPDRAFISRFFRTIFPVVLNEGLWATGTTMYSVVYGRMGDAVVAAMSNIVGAVDQLMFVMGWGIMSATAVIVGRSIGAGREEEAYLYAKRLLLAAVAAMIGMGVLLLCTRGSIVQLFSYADSTRDMARQVLLVTCLCMWVRAFNAVNVVGVLRSGGDTLYSMILDVGALWLVGVPVVVVTGLALELPLVWVYVASQAEEFLKMAVALPRFLSKKWIHNLVQNEQIVSL